MHQPDLSRLRSFALVAAFIWALCSPLHAEDTEPLKLPKPIKATSDGAFYPSPARRLGQEGRVLVAFKISSAGRVLDVRVTAAEPHGVFDNSVTTYIRSWEFAVPADWEASGGTHHEYTISFVFRLQPCHGTSPREESAPFPADYQPIIITGSTICVAPPAKHTTQAEADRVYCEYMREQGGSPASCAKP
jgi:TonB family protein